MSNTTPKQICSSAQVSGLASRSDEETDLRMTSADSWGRIDQVVQLVLIQGTQSECWGQLVNLRVPSPIRRQTEKKTPGFMRLFGGHKKSFRRRKKSQNIGRVTVPDILVLDTADDSGMDHSNQYDKPNSMGECSNLNSDDNFFTPEFDEGQEFDWIPSVKPWTEEELREIKNKYSLIEDEVKKESEQKKRKQKAHVRGSDVSSLALDKYKSLRQHKNTENKGLNVSISHDNRINRTILRKSPLTVALPTEDSGKSQIFKEAVSRNQTR